MSTYGPTATPTLSPLAYGPDGVACVWWECGLQPGKITDCPPFTIEIPIKDGGVARASFPASVQRPLVNAIDRERVAEHWAVATLPARLGVGPRRKVCGIHAFVEERSDGFVGVEIVVNFGTLDPAKPGSWPGAVRFSDIRVVLPKGWTRQGGTFGPAGDWYGPPRGWTSRRMAFVGPGGNAANASGWLGHAGLQVDGHPCLGPARHKMPKMKDSRHNPLGAGIGAGPFLSDTTYPGGDEVSGKGIVPEGGWEGSTAAARSYSDDVRRVLSGHPIAAFHVKTGEPIWPVEWLTPKGFPMTNGYLRCNKASGNLPPIGSLVRTFGWDQLESGPKELNPGPSASRYTMNSIQPKDGAHYIRFIQACSGAWYSTRSFAARLGMHMAAIHVASSGIMHGSNMFLREFWTLKSLACAIAILPPGQERDDMLDERDLALKRLSDTIHANGWERAGAYPNSDNGEPWAMGMPHEYATAAAWQLAFYVDALYCALTVAPVVSITPERATWLLTEAISKMVDSPLMVNGSPPTHVGVIKGGVVEMPVHTGTADRAYDNHSNHDAHALKLCKLWTGDKRYDDLAARCTYPPPPEWAAIPKAYA